MHLVRHCRLPESRITTIPNGVDTAFFRPAHYDATPSTKYILCVARLVPDKDHETLLAAFGLLAAKHSDVNLLLIGNGEQREALERFARNRIPAGRFQFLPVQPDLRPLFARSIFLALSSCREALPNVVLEAMASGLPVVATAVGGLPDVIEQGRTGFLVPKRDPAALAHAMEKLLTDASKRAAFGEAGRKRVEADYSIHAMVRSHEELFCRLLTLKK
jgi:glycosyltransferase involved in cell wall biosynthesis